ncbi:MAG: hypothetical protein ACR2KQ_09180 [Actinomycetota bacterium]
MSTRPKQSHPRRLDRSEDDLMMCLRSRDLSLAFLELEEAERSSFHHWIDASATVAQRRRRIEILAVALSATDPRP